MNLITILSQINKPQREYTCIDPKYTLFLILNQNKTDDKAIMDVYFENVWRQFNIFYNYWVYKKITKVKKK